MDLRKGREAGQARGMRRSWPARGGTQRQSLPRKTLSWGPTSQHSSQAAHLCQLGNICTWQAASKRGLHRRRRPTPTLGLGEGGWRRAQVVEVLE
eukprot:8080503-Pyramimonas_sp.AAC.1